MIELESVSKLYQGTQGAALQDVSLRVAQGGFCLLTGPSGAGKSTLLRLLFRAEAPSSGRVLVGGIDVARLRPRRVPALRRTIGVVFQDFRLLGSTDVFHNVAVALEVQGLPWREIRSRVTATLERVGLAHKAHARIGALSGGEQQRVAIARALVPEPALLLCDEPTGNLDEDRARGIVALLDEAHARGTTVVVATHDPSLFGGAGRRTVRLQDGRIVGDTDAASTDVAAAPAGERDARPDAPSDGTSDGTVDLVAAGAPGDPAGDPAADPAGGASGGANDSASKDGSGAARQNRRRRLSVVK